MFRVSLIQQEESEITCDLKLIFSRSDYENLKIEVEEMQDDNEYGYCCSLLTEIIRSLWGR